MPIEPCNVNGWNIFHEHTPHQVLNLMFIVNAGSKDDGESQGTAHFVEHMFFKGTESRSWREANQLISRIGKVSAYTWPHCTVYHLNLLPGDYPDAVDVMVDMLCHPRIDEEELEKERGVIVEEAQSRLDNSRIYFWDHVYERFRTDPGWHPITGSKEHVKRITASELRDFRDRFYKPRRIAISIVGDISWSLVERELAKRLPQVESSSLECRDLSGAHDFSPVNLTHDAEQAAYVVMSPAESRVDSIKHHFADEILARILGGDSSSLIYERLRNELGLCYSAGTIASIGGFSSYVYLSPDQIPRARDEIANVISGVRCGDFDDDRVQTAKKSHVFHLRWRAERATGRAAITTASCFNCNELPTIEEQIQAICKLSKSDIVAAAERIFGRGMKEMTLNARI